jgi:hypothetical protein
MAPNARSRGRGDGEIQNRGKGPASDVKVRPPRSKRVAQEAPENDAPEVDEPASKKGASKVSKSSSPGSARNCILNAVRARTCGASRGDKGRQAGLRLPQGPGVQAGIGRKRSNAASGTPYRSPALFFSLATSTIVMCWRSHCSKPSSAKFVERVRHSGPAHTERCRQKLMRGVQIIATQPISSHQQPARQPSFDYALRVCTSCVRRLNKGAMEIAQQAGRYCKLTLRAMADRRSSTASWRCRWGAVRPRDFGGRRARAVRMPVDFGLRRD